MALLAPNIYILQYLKNTQQLTPAIMEKATKFLTSGELLFNTLLFHVSYVRGFQTIHITSRIYYRSICITTVRTTVNISDLNYSE